MGARQLAWAWSAQTSGSAELKITLLALAELACDEGFVEVSLGRLSAMTAILVEDLDDVLSSLANTQHVESYSVCGSYDNPNSLVTIQINEGRQ